MPGKKTLKDGVIYDLMDIYIFICFQDINVCILENYPECSNPRVFYIIPYFCGQHPQCRYLRTLKWHDKAFCSLRRWENLVIFYVLSCKASLPLSVSVSDLTVVSLTLIFLPLSTREPGVWALERAKQNVLENYLLVGILEELEDVLLLLERLLPHYFTGVLNIYKSPGTLVFQNAFSFKYHICS